MSSTGDVIRRSREAKNLSMEALGAAVGVDKRTISRYENGESEPSLSTAAALAAVLEVSLTELAGMEPQGLDLTGRWWAAWQTWMDEVERIDVHPLTIAQDGAVLAIDGSRARSVTEGSYEWRGEMRLWDGESVMGWYVATDGAVRSKGALYFALHPHGSHMVGSWVGLSQAGLVIRGWGAIARERDHVEQVIAELVATDGNLRTWPTRPN
ncbi:helix-turn-helix domain-containing protein [Nocardia sp. XZ_19_385]|uniref:helix-turn-helix domain-containing protein n=1 Tax=Nocardia sp. XZ_19_385 TaxID=2769488 RepID=UPI00188EA096|nr:helix-turn-helix transcriptional regulator [Nocardia sp. XZ_19_385]